jgi:drug/metabolite transporter (DMT)-like permease
VTLATTPASVIMLGVVLTAPVVLYIGMVVANEPMVPTNGDAWLWLALLAIVPQSIGQGLIIWGLRSLPASFIAIVLLLQPVATTIWGELMLDEPVRGVDIVFGALVLLGIVLARLGIREALPTTLPTCSTSCKNSKT